MKYSGSCHCGQVRYEVETEIKSLISCNCSICHKNGSLLAFAPAANFKLLQGESYLSDYQFGEKTIHHMFCKQCGVSVFGKGAMPDGAPMRAIQARCLDGVDLEQFPVQKYDGKSK